MSKAIFAALLSLALGIAAPSAFAGSISDPATPNPSANPDPPGNLVLNGSFQTGNFADWTVTNNIRGNTFVTSNGGLSGFNSEDASDPFLAAIGNVGSDVRISQVVSDVAGQSYTFSFYFASDGGTPNDFSAEYDGHTLFTTTNTADTRPNYDLETFTVTGTGSDTIQFNGRNDPGFDALDNVSLTSSSTVPEPSSAGLVLIGFGLLAGLAWWRSRTPV
ncbi:MAG: PEP-CTERM sorting domain-containing protein [Deltaproteobacteria bacterium]|nr:PEP-CTERM sorting domain-containing protein [Deltaproteobacteria bacterium]